MQPKVGLNLPSCLLIHFLYSWYKNPEGIYVLPLLISSWKTLWFPDPEALRRHLRIIRRRPQLSSFSPFENSLSELPPIMFFLWPAWEMWNWVWLSCFMRSSQLALLIFSKVDKPSPGNLLRNSSVPVYILFRLELVYEPQDFFKAELWGGPGNWMILEPFKQVGLSPGMYHDLCICLIAWNYHLHDDFAHSDSVFYGSKTQGQPAMITLQLKSHFFFFSLSFHEF